MTIQLDPYQLITLICTIAAALFGIFKMILTKIDTQFLKIEADTKNESKEQGKEILRIDRELLALKADLPNQYQRRDDAIRNQTIIEAKIDGLANRLGEMHVIERRSERRNNNE
ncbi:MAG: hypothetical protein QX189_04410 [Methylococcales bacterium]